MLNIVAPFFFEIGINSKLRIRKVTFKDGEVTYFIQKKTWLGWYDCVRLVGMDTYSYVAYEDLEEAQEYIKEHAKRKEETSLHVPVKKEVIECSRFQK
jgi:hypothetical protein